MTDADAFLAHIIANPEDDLVRLAYADYLAEQDDRGPCPECPPDEGEESHPADIPCKTCSGSRSVPAGNAARAELIRVQCELAKLPRVLSYRGSEQVYSFDFRRGDGFFQVAGLNPELPEVGDLVDVELSAELMRAMDYGGKVRKEYYKKFWGGLLVTGVGPWMGRPRIQFRLNNGPDHADNVRKLTARQAALLAAHGRAWSGEVMVALGVDRAAYHARSGWLSPQHTLYGDGLPATGWKFSRGFVGSVRLPTLAELVGDRACGKCVKGWVWTGELDGETGHRIEMPCLSCSRLGRVRACPGCGGEDADGPVATVDCQTCNRSGILPALAPRLARVPGITHITAADRVPELDRIWYRAGRPDPYLGIPESAELPPLLFDLLDGYNVDKELGPEVTPGRWKAYPTRDAATSALALAGGGLLRSL